MEIIFCSLLLAIVLSIWWSVKNIEIEVERKNTLTEKQNEILEKISESLSKTNNNE